MYKTKIFNLKFLNIYLGNLFEHYDTALYSFLSPFFAEIFFKDQNYLLALIITFAMIPLGKLIRPIGALFFGYIGDIYGREKALVISFFGMSISTILIAFIPTNINYTSFLFLFFRISQNFFASSENIGGAIFLLEDIENENEKNYLSSIYSTSVILGILFASFFVSIFYHFNLLQQYWRLLYLFGAITAFFGTIIRISYSKKNISIKKNINFLSFIKEIIFFKNKRSIFLIIFASGFSYATYAMAFVVLNGFIPIISNITKTTLMKLNTIFLMFDFLLLIFFGKISTKVNREKLMISSLIFAIFSSPFLFFLLNDITLLKVIILRTYIVIIGVWFSSTFHSYTQSLIEPNFRYRIISISDSLGSLILGSTTSMISLFIFKKTNYVLSISWYWIILSIFTAMFIFLNKPINAVNKISSET